LLINDSLKTLPAIKTFYNSNTTGAVLLHYPHGFYYYVLMPDTFNT